MELGRIKYLARRGKRAKRSRNAKTSPHPASGIRAPLPDATLTRLIRPTTLCLNRRPDKAFMPHSAMTYSLFRFKSQQPVGVTHYGDRRERHCRSGNHRVKQCSSERPQNTGGDRNTNAVVDKRTEQVLLDRKSVV